MPHSWSHEAVPPPPDHPHHAVTAGPVFRCLHRPCRLLLATAGAHADRVLLDGLVIPDADPRLLTCEFAPAAVAPPADVPPIAGGPVGVPVLTAQQALRKNFSSELKALALILPDSPNVPIARAEASAFRDACWSPDIPLLRAIILPNPMSTVFVAALQLDPLPPADKFRVDALTLTAAEAMLRFMRARLYVRTSRAGNLPPTQVLASSGGRMIKAEVHALDLVLSSGKASFEARGVDLHYVVPDFEYTSHSHLRHIGARLLSFPLEVRYQLCMEYVSNVISAVIHLQPPGTYVAVAKWQLTQQKLRSVSSGVSFVPPPITPADGAPAPAGGGGRGLSAGGAGRGRGRGRFGGRRRPFPHR